MTNHARRHLSKAAGGDEAAVGFVVAHRCIVGRIVALVEQIGLHDLPFREEGDGPVVDCQIALGLVALRVASHFPGVQLLLDVHALARQVDVSPCQSQGLAAADARCQSQPYGYDTAA